VDPKRRLVAKVSIHDSTPADPKTEELIVKIAPA